MRTRMYGGVTGKAGDSLPMSIRLVIIAARADVFYVPIGRLHSEFALP
jgi:hypothetical protein